MKIGGGAVFGKIKVFAYKCEGSIQVQKTKETFFKFVSYVLNVILLPKHIINEVMILTGSIIASLIKVWTSIKFVLNTPVYIKDLTGNGKVFFYVKGMV